MASKRNDGSADEVVRPERVVLVPTARLRIRNGVLQQWMNCTWQNPESPKFQGEWQDIPIVGEDAPEYY